MKTNIATTPDQSARLIACGVDPKSADFVWMDDNPPRLTLRTEIIEDSNPYIVAFAWSLSALFTSVIPPNIVTGYGDEKYSHCPKLMKCRDGWKLILFAIHTADTPIECAVLCVEWLAKNGYKLNEIKQ